MDEKAAVGSGATTHSNDRAWRSYSSRCAWPPRSHYKCSFCKREFKSAQALGGHMNVHRRDKAKVQCRPSPPSPPNPNPDPIPNPSDVTLSVPPSLSSSIYNRHYSLVSLSLSCLSPSSPCRANGGNLGLKFHDPSSKEGANVKLDLELGLITHSHRDEDKDADQDLDLELRLGT